MLNPVEHVGIDLARNRDQDERIEQLLALARTGLGMEAAFVVEFEPEDEAIRNVEGDALHFGLAPGEPTPLARHAREAVEGLAPSMVRDASDTGGIEDCPALRAAGVGAAVCVPVELSDDRLFGALCSVARGAEPSLDEADAMFVRVVAQSIADELEREELGGHPLDVAFQPIFDLGREEVIAYEAFPRLAGAGLELALEYVYELPPGVRLALNVSPGAAASPALARVLQGVEDRIVIELTEHEDIEDYGALERALETLRARGALVAVDDAGAGFSTFERILRLAPDVVKVDLRTAGLAHPTRRALVAALIFFASTTDATIVAEGIETPNELSVVQRLKIAYGQGSWLGVPGPLPCAAR